MKGERVVGLVLVVIFVFSMSSQNIFAHHWEENNMIIDSDFDDNLEVVNGHRVTITGATVGGNVDVDGGAVTVNGNIEIKNGAVTITQSIIEGNVMVDGGMGTVTITQSIIDGNIMVDGGMVTVKNGSTVNGNIEIKNGGRIILDDVVINGNFNAEESIFVIITGSSFDGNIEINDHKGMCFIKKIYVDGNYAGCS